MNNAERMKAGLIYDPGDVSLQKEQTERLEWLYDYNHSRPSGTEYRKELLEKMMGHIGEGCVIEPPFYANWAGKNVYFGDYVYANFGLTVVDDVDIRVGDHVMFAPHVTISAANHPILPELRERGLQYNREVIIGNNVWVGAHAVILPGVHIGDNTVIAAGSVVTRDIPANVLAMGIPCRVIREIGEYDREYFRKGEKIDWENVSKYLE